MPSYLPLVGDLHSHCDISYGVGSLAEALAAAREHLDFVSVTGHANWPDMPTDRDRYGRIIDYHTAGFERLAATWDEVSATVEAANLPGEFPVFHSFEWHNNAAGDHNVYFPAAGGPLISADSLEQLRDRAGTCDALVIPHHIGYGPGLRGVDWDRWTAERSPFAEIVSLHGCSESDSAPYPMLHDMGPRRGLATASEAFRRGYHVGLVGGTDHHGAYPGSYGDGRMVALATARTREALWEAFTARRVYALTGDRILVDCHCDDLAIGAIGDSGKRRRVRCQVVGSDWLQHVELLKNERRLHFLAGMDPAAAPAVRRYKIRIEMGWGPKTATTRWEGLAEIDGGELLSVEPCFTGPAIVSPDDAAADDPRLRQNRILTRTPQQVAWECHSRGNPTMHHRSTQAVVLELHCDPSARLRLRLNGVDLAYRVSDLAERSETHVFGGWLGPAARVWQAVPEPGYSLGFELDDAAETAEDCYRLRVCQRNGQWAWTSPVWVRS